ncbi:MAG: branched-chain amino acid transaminase [Bacteroidia bacterium]
MNYYDDQTYAFFDGAYSKVSEIRIDPFSQSLHYGNSIFEGLRAYKTSNGIGIFKARKHFERMAEAAARLGVALPYPIDELIQTSYRLLEINGLQDAYIRPLLYPGANMSLSATPESHLLILTWKWGRLLGDSCVNLTVSDVRLPDANFIEAKVSGRYVHSVMATTAARARGFNDAIMLDSRGHVCGAAGANLFIEKNEVLLTPARGNILPGITRQTVLELAKDMGIQTIEKDLDPSELAQADAAFLAGTAVEITGVESIDGRTMPTPWTDSIGYMINRQYKKLVTNSNAHEWTLI